MRLKKAILVLFTLANTSIYSQKPEDLLNNWAIHAPIEKVYLHFDRDNYLAGETAWFKAYLYSDYQPDTISTSLYVEFLKKGSDIITRKVLPVFFGGASGQIELPDSLITGNYIVRAYTVTMLNQDPGFIFSKNILVYGKNGDKINETAPEHKMRVEFFPEGGNLISGINNVIAFKATDENGLPVVFNGSLKNEKGEIITSVSSYHDGMGMFELNPSSNEKYYVESDNASKFSLPEQTNKGIAITIIPHPQGSYFDLQQKTEDPAFMAAYMLGQMQHHIVFKQDFPPGKPELHGVINTLNLNSGILQVTFFNKDGIPLAERLCFVNNKEYMQAASLDEDTLDFSARSKNHFSISIRDTAQANLSVSVTDADLLSSTDRDENIYSTLLLTDDIKGYVHRPSYYFSSDNDSVKTSLDLLMMTNGWRRFKWTELDKKAVLFRDNRYITLSGKITVRGIKKPFSNSQVLLMITGYNKKRSTQFLQTDKDGRFIIDSMVFVDRNRLLFTDIHGKKSQYIDVYLDKDSLQRKFALPNLHPLPYYSLNGNLTKWQMDYDAIMKAEGVMLEGVTVKVRKKTPEEEVEDRYVGGMFSGPAEHTYDLVHAQDEMTPYRNIFDYLQFRVPGLTITNDGLDYTVFYRQVASASSMGNFPMTLYLDELETDASVISAVPANQVALVKIFSTFAAATGNAPGGVLAVYTKKGSDVTSSAGFANLSFYNGYSVAKEFYSPDYSVNKDDPKPDNRITLAWRPDIFVNTLNAKIPVTFYNSDRTKKYKVVVEGITVSGKMIHIEKIISPASKGF